MHIDQLINYKISNSFLTFMTNQNLDQIEERVKYLLDLNNSIIIISEHKVTLKSLQKYVKKGNY